MEKLRIGVLINPIAGMGGSVGLKGTDNVAKKAAALDAKPIAPERALEFLTRLKELGVVSRVELVTCPGSMGDNKFRKAGLAAEVLPMSCKKETTAEDTKFAIRLMTKLGVRLVTFVGGDGTARDILDATRGKSEMLFLGVPSGVKMYSGIFAASPKDAADIVGDFIEGSVQLMDLEVMDVDEEAVRSDRLNVRLYGLLKGPFTPMRLLGSKQVSPETEDENENQKAIARFIVEETKPEGTYILGPGTTIKCIADLLGVEKTVLGVDIYRDKRVIKDVNERRIKHEVKDWRRCWIVLSPIGRQGMLLGRGNQQISPEVIKHVGREHIIIAATKSKIQGIDGGVLRVDTGDQEADKMLRGYIKVATDYREWRLMKVV